MAKAKKSTAGPLWTLHLVGLGLPPWFRKVYLSCHNSTPLGSSCSGLNWPQVSVGSSALVPGWWHPARGPSEYGLHCCLVCVPWCRRLESLPSIKPQLYSDNLQCSSVCLVQAPCMFGAAWFTVQYVRSNIFRALFLRPGTSKLVFSWRVGRVFEVLRRTLEGGSFGEG